MLFTNCASTVYTLKAAKENSAASNGLRIKQGVVSNWKIYAPVSGLEPW